MTETLPLADAFHVDPSLSVLEIIQCSMCVIGVVVIAIVLLRNRRRPPVD